MTIELIILAILVTPFLATLAFVRAPSDPRAIAAGRLGLAAAFVFFAAGHFMATQAMATMFPPFVPEPELIVYATGIVEALIAVGLVLPQTRRLAGMAAIIVFIAFFPANIYAAFMRADVIGHAWGPVYLLIRGPFQLLLIVWAWWFVVRRPV
ncbi:DoxX family protein [Maricaulaceae bacterium MS644]